MIFLTDDFVLFVEVHARAKPCIICLIYFI